MFRSMTHIQNTQNKITDQLAECIFNQGDVQSKKQMTRNEYRMILDSVMMGLHLERSKPRPSQLVNFVREIFLNIKKFERLYRMELDVQKFKHQMFETLYFNPNLSMSTLLEQQSKVLQSQIEEKKRIKQQKDQDDYVALIRKLELQEQQQEQEKEQKQKELQKPTICSICQDQLDYQDRWYLNACQHMYHRACLVTYFEMKIKEKDFPLRCPEQKCKKEVLYDDLTLILNEITLTQYNQCSIEMAVTVNPKDMKWCPTPNCKFAFAITQGISEFSCPMCKKACCVSCEVEFHKGQTCAQYKASQEKQNDVNFTIFAQKSNFKQCSQCKVWVEKNQGCNHITCKCKYEFCYACGGPYPKCLRGNSVI